MFQITRRRGVISVATTFAPRTNDMADLEMTVLPAKKGCRTPYLSIAFQLGAKSRLLRYEYAKISKIINEAN